MQVDSDVAAVDQKRRAGVHSDPHLNGAAAKSLMRLFRSGERAVRRRECDEERVSLRVNLDAAVSRERIPQSSPALNERLAVQLGAELLQQPRRAFDVCEQEGDSARGQGAHLGGSCAIPARPAPPMPTASTALNRRSPVPSSGIEWGRRCRHLQHLRKANRPAVGRMLPVRPIRVDGVSAERQQRSAVVFGATSAGP